MSERVPGPRRRSHRRRVAVGVLAGVGPGVLLTAVSGPVGFAAGVVGGAVFAAALDPARGVTSHGAVGGGAAVPAWVLVTLTAVPVANGASPLWTPSGVRTALPALGVWLVAGTLLGLATAAVEAVAASLGVGSRPAGTDDEEPPTRIVVAGGGFVGLSAARRLERAFGPDPTVELTVVSRDNATLFTPLLAEVAGGSVSPTHITTPLRAALDRTRVVEAAVTDVDTEARRLRLDAAAGPRGLDRTVEDAPPEAPRTLPYDHLILGLGSVPDDRGIDPERESVFDFKTLGDAIRIRNHVIGRFERAAATDDSEERATATRFVVAGGGFAGVELAGAVNDLAHALLPYYPGVERSAVEVVLVHSRERIFPELDDALADYALDRLRDRGVEFELGVRVENVEGDGDGVGDVVAFSDGRSLRAGTVVWTAGNQPHPVVASLSVPHEGPGAVAVEETLSVPGVEGVWAAGDCAAVRDAETGDRHPNTAQHAIRAGAAAAENVHATVTGGEPTPFSYRSQGTLAVIGHQVAVAQVMGRRFSGLAAWLFWRAVYLGKLPGTAQKLRVALDWVADLFFPRDLVRTIETDLPRRAGADAATGPGEDPASDGVTGGEPDPDPDGGDASDGDADTDADRSADAATGAAGADGQSGADQ